MSTSAEDPQEDREWHNAAVPPLLSPSPGPLPATLPQGPCHVRQYGARTAQRIGRLEIDRHVTDHAEQVLVPQPRVADAVDGPDRVVHREDLRGLVRGGQGLLQGTACRLRREAVDRLLGERLLSWLESTVIWKEPILRRSLQPPGQQGDHDAQMSEGSARRE